MAWLASQIKNCIASARTGTVVEMGLICFTVPAFHYSVPQKLHSPHFSLSEEIV